MALLSSHFPSTRILCLVPESKLLRRPPLVHSTTFFSWLRLSYPSFRRDLAKAIQEMKEQMLKFDVQLVDEILETGEKKMNPYRSRYIH